MGCFRLDRYKVDEVPEGFTKTKGATTAPKGWVWYHKGSLFMRRDYEHVLVPESASKKWEDKQ